jgi:hypothetical protein
MEVGVVSDTHGNLEGLRKAIHEILSKHDVNLFIHLGDEYEDAEVFDEFACEYLRVPGVYDDRYRDRAIPNRLMKEFEGWKFLVTHTDTSDSHDLPEDLRPEDLVAARHVDVVLYGHSHAPRLAVRNRMLFLNPGHLKKEDKKGYPATYAIISITETAVRARIVVLDTGKTLEEVLLRKA